MSAEQTCGTCKWWKPSRGETWANEARGECHGAPPHIKRLESGGHHEPAGYRIWPVTDRHDFCATHSPPTTIAPTGNVDGER